MEYESRGRSESSDVHIGQNVHQVPFTTSSKTQPTREQISVLHKFIIKVYRPAAKSVPFAEPNVEIATDRGISQAITPNIKLPKVCK